MNVGFLWAVACDTCPDMQCGALSHRVPGLGALDLGSGVKVVEGLDICIVRTILTALLHGRCRRGWRRYGLLWGVVQALCALLKREVALRVLLARSLLELPTVESWAGRKFSFKAAVVFAPLLLLFLR